MAKTPVNKFEGTDEQAELCAQWADGLVEIAEDSHWDMEHVSHGLNTMSCGASSCAVGWLPKIFAGKWEYHGPPAPRADGIVSRVGEESQGYDDTVNHLTKFFGLSVREVWSITGTDGYVDDHERTIKPGDITRKMVAARIRSIVE